MEYYEYDDYDRPLNINYASGKMDTYSYLGNEVTKTVSDITTTNKYDVAGALISVTDPAGTITYNLRPDGQPESITAPGDIVTSFKYDNYGRQTSIVDPSAGTKLFTYNDAGQISSTTDANGKVITTDYNRYGNITSTARPEFTTNYTYDIDGLLTAENSTNGTGKSYTYDKYNRLIAEKENVLNNNWLQKTYSYDNGNISSSAYTSQYETITTENYTYTNGTLTEIKLNNNTSIWKLNGENDLSQPTSVTTGALARTYLYDQYGLPTGRTAGNVQNVSYAFDTLKGNLIFRKDNSRNIQENFTYDNLNRLVGFGGKTAAYDEKGNITSLSDIGSMKYTQSDKPYAVSGIDVLGNSIPLRNQKITYASFMRPLTIEENGYNATIDYNADGERVRTSILNNRGYNSTRHLIDNKYEICDGSDYGFVEYLYLAGDTYSAPAVYVKDWGSDEQWHLYNICRDYQGSITHITDANGTLAQELSYDAWGRLRNPADQTVYEPDKEPKLFLRRGYTGHEHLAVFGLINMNARLYDPAVGRFLAPDPYVQAPDFSQNFNRYSYCLNNPLCYVDKNGEFFFIIGGALIGAYIGASLKSHSINPAKWTSDCWKGALVGGVAGAFVGGAIGAMWEAGASISFGLNVGSLKTLTLLTFNPATATTGGLATMSIGGGLGLGSGLTFALSKKDDEKTANKLADNTNTPNLDKKDSGQNENGTSLGPTFYGDLMLSGRAEHMYSENRGMWTGKNGKIYDLNWGGNQYTGSRLLAKKMSSYLNRASHALGYYDIASSWYGVYEGNNSTVGAIMDTGFGGAGIYGGIYGAWANFWYNMGKEYGPIHLYLEYKNGIK